MSRDEFDFERREIFIGDVRFVHAKFARVAPRAVAGPEGWRKIASGRFPDEGTVFSVDQKILRHREGHVILFTIVRNDRPSAKDGYVTDTIEEPVDVLHALAGLSPPKLRELVVSRGVDRGQAAGRRALIPLNSDSLAFPELQRSAETGLWTLSHLEDAERIDLFENDLRPSDLVEIGGRRYLLPGRAPRRTVGQVNWQTDTEFLHALLKRIRRNADFGSGSEDFRLTERLAGRLHGLYRDADIVGDRAGALLAVRDRLDEFLPRLTEGSEAAALVADAVLANPIVRAELASLTADEIDVLRRAEVERVRPEIVRRIEDELAERSAERDRVRGAVAEAKTELEAKTSRLAEIESSLEAATARLRGTFGSLLSEVRDAGQAIAAMSMAAGTFPIEEFSTRESPRDDLAPWASRATTFASSMGLSELPETGRQTAEDRGIDPIVLRSVDVLCRAGEIPMLHGDSVETLLDCYADLVAGGRLQRQALDPSVLGAEDLWRRSGSGTATAFAHAWAMAARDPETVVLVCLDDVDRASLSDWFPAFGRLYRARRPTNLLVMATATTVAGELAAGDRTIDVPVSTTGGRNAFTAAFMRDRGLSKRTALAPPVVSDTASDRERRALMARALARGAVGADLAERLVAVYASARTWCGHEEATSVALDLLVVPERIDRSTSNVPTPTRERTPARMATS